MENIHGVGVEESKEMLRYYSHDGKIAHLPLLHFSPFVRTYFLGISRKTTTKLDQCFLVLPRISRRNASVSRL